jgi:tetratricopeptide (TPR) repeat protein
VLERESGYAHAIEQTAWCYTLQGRLSEALAEFESLGPRDLDPVLAYLYARSGQRDKALRMTRAMEQRAEIRCSDPVPIAGMGAALGDMDRAFTWLDKALDERAPDLYLLAVDPFLDSLRADPRFESRLGRMGLTSVRPLADSSRRVEGGHAVLERRKPDSSPQLCRYPAIDPPSFRRRLDEVLIRR